MGIWLKLILTVLQNETICTQIGNPSEFQWTKTAGGALSSTPSLELLQRQLHLPPIDHGGGPWVCKREFDIAVALLRGFQRRILKSDGKSGRRYSGQTAARDANSELRGYCHDTRWRNAKYFIIFSQAPLWEPLPPGCFGGRGGGIYRGYCVNTDPTHWLANWDAFIIYFRVRGRERTGDYDQVTLTMSTQAECGLSQTLIVGLLSDRSWAAHKAMTHSLKISAAKRRIQNITSIQTMCFRQTFEVIKSIDAEELE